MLDRISQLIDAVRKEPFRDAGKPEPLKHDWTGYRSRRINAEHRLAYKVQGDILYSAQCRYHD